MRGLSKLKAWLKRKGFTSTDYKGDSEYYTLNGFSATVRLADHVGREGTETDKYINIIPDGVDRYVFIYDRISTSMSHKELIKALDALIYLHGKIPKYFENRDLIKKRYEDAISSVQSHLARRTVDQRAVLVKGVSTLEPVILELQKLCCQFRVEKEKL